MRWKSRKALPTDGNSTRSQPHRVDEYRTRTGSNSPSSLKRSDYNRSAISKEKENARDHRHAARPGLAGCAPSEPRSTQFFEANIDEARALVAGCREGSVRGGECTNAEQAVIKIECRECRKRFYGDGKA